MHILRHLLIIVSLLLPVALRAAADDIDKQAVVSQLHRLDHELTKRDKYIAARQARIDSIRSAIISANTRDVSWLKDVMALAESYNTFNMDSALYYYSEGYRQALALDNDTMATRFKLRRATMLPVVGFVKEALEEFEEVDSTQMPASLRTFYEESGRQMYSYIAAFYINYPQQHDHYKRLTTRHQQELLARLPHNSPQYQLNLGEYYFDRQEFTKSRQVLQDLLKIVPETDNIYARAAHCLSTIAKARGNRDEYIYYLTRSAISDTRSATLEVSSMQELGGVLFEQGDVERAHRYLLGALDGAVRGHATMRLIQTAEGMPIIEAAHQSELSRQHRRIYFIIGILGLLLLVLLVTVWFIRREMRRMAELHRRLETANHTKDIYISQFLSLCSIYMDKLHQFNKIVNRKISAGQVEELFKMTKSGKFVEEQSREFYEVFDDAFLHIYPTFVDSINALLRPDQQIVLGEGEKLNTDLRILAFMRLGIEDSSKIAQVLNYSVNTIYTYRNKLKNKAINRDTFEADIQKISSIG